MVMSTPETESLPFAEGGSLGARDDPVPVRELLHAGTRLSPGLWPVGQ
jgi:hypothetical protein